MFHLRQIFRSFHVHQNSSSSLDATLLHGFVIFVINTLFRLKCLSSIAGRLAAICTCTICMTCLIMWTQSKEAVKGKNLWWWMYCNILATPLSFVLKWSLFLKCASKTQTWKQSAFNSLFRFLFVHDFNNLFVWFAVATTATALIVGSPASRFRFGSSTSPLTAG